MLFVKSLLAALRDVPRFVWILLAVALLYRFAVDWHDGRKDAFRAEVRAELLATIEAERQQLEDRLADLKEENARLQRAANDHIRRDHAQALGAIAARDDDLGLRGPGKAQCVTDATGRAGAGVSRPADRGPAAGAVDAGVSALPVDQRVDLIGLPFADARAFARSHDTCYAALGAWQSWYPAMKAAHEQWAAEAAKAAR